MTGTFASFNTASSALRFAQVSLDVASSNIANSTTAGYTRRRVEAGAVGAPSVPAMWSRYDGAGDGVTVRSVTRMSDALLDARVRTEHGNQGSLDVQQTGLEQLESGVNEPGPNGVVAALADFRSAMHDLANDPGPSSAARSSLLGKAGALAAALNAQSAHLDATALTVGQQVGDTVQETNTVAASLADTNKAIASGTLAGADVSSLLDTRDSLTLRLSELTGGTTSLQPDGTASVTVGGVALVAGPVASTLSVTSGLAADGTPTGSPLTFAVTAPGGAATPTTAPLGGQAGGATQLLNVTFPAYRAGLDATAKQLADTVNAQQGAGYDAAGNAGTPLFTYDPTRPSASLAVAITDPSRLAASGVAGGPNLDGSNATLMAAPSGAESSYQQLVTGLGTQVQGAQRAAANQQVLTDQFDSSREQQAGVNVDEETVSMLQSQRTYEAAAKVMSTLDSVLDTIINRMGV